MVSVLRLEWTDHSRWQDGKDDSIYRQTQHAAPRLEMVPRCVGFTVGIYFGGRFSQNVLIHRRKFEDIQTEQINSIDC